MMIIQPKTSFKTTRVGGVMVSVQPKPKTPYSVLQVASFVDTGQGRHMVILKNALPTELEIDIDTPYKSRTGVSVPRNIGGLQCVYTGRSVGVVADPAEAIRAVTWNARLAAIVPEVVAPGDFLIYRYEGARLKMRFAGVLRAIKMV